MVSLSNWLARQSVKLFPSGHGGSNPSGTTNNYDHVSRQRTFVVLVKGVVLRMIQGRYPGPAKNGMLWVCSSNGRAVVF